MKWVELRISTWFFITKMENLQTHEVAYSARTPYKVTIYITEATETTGKGIAFTLCQKN